MFHEHGPHFGPHFKAAFKHEHHHHNEEAPEFDGEPDGGFGRNRGHGRGPRGGRGGPHGGPRGGPHGGPGDGGRARRGALRYVLLDALRDGPKHGYEIIKAFEERTQGQYGPSPGTVYPTLQYLEELGLVRADQTTERRVYHLTDAGRADLETHADEVKAFWADFGGAVYSSTSRHEIGFLHHEMEDLVRTVRFGVRSVIERDDPETIRRVRQAVEQCKNEVRRIISEPRQTPSSGEPPAA
jgi:DNA-binding PadR family transcriptional regulator